MKKMMALSMIMAVFLSGCNDTVYSADYYFEHQEEAKKIIEKCKIGEITNKNCETAKEAIQKQSRQDWIKAHGGK